MKPALIQSPSLLSSTESASAPSSVMEKSASITTYSIALQMRRTSARTASTVSAWVSPDRRRSAITSTVIPMRVSPALATSARRRSQIVFLWRP